MAYNPSVTARHAAPSTASESSTRRKVTKVISLAALAASLGAIWMLTVQTPAETSSLSGWWVRWAQNAGVPIDAATASFIARKAAHTVEFFPVGLAAMTAALIQWGDRVPTRKLALGTAVFCAVCSVADQTHKLFVPGREFDVRDIGCDALGYLLAIFVVTSAYRLYVARRK